jgi:hypothetical protein
MYNQGHFMVLVSITVIQMIDAKAHRGLDHRAVPSFVILGVAKGGTTDLYSMISSLHSGFHSDKFKEIDVANLCEQPCTPEKLQCLIQCPKLTYFNCSKSVGRATNITDDKSCSMWLAHFNTTAASYKYTMEANPSQYLRTAQYPHFFQDLAQQSAFQTLFLLSLREPVSTIRSLFNHWNWNFMKHAGTHVLEPLENVLDRELRQLSSPKNSKLLGKLSSLLLHNPVNCDKIILAFEELQRNVAGAESVTKWDIDNKMLKNYVLSHIYVLHLIVYMTKIPSIRGSIMVVKAEYEFSDRIKFFYDDLVPFMHPIGVQSSRKFSIVPRENSSEILGQVKNAKPVYIKEAHLSEAMTTRLHAFYQRFPVEPYLRYLQENGLAKVVPPISVSGPGMDWWNSSRKSNSNITRD